MSDPNEAAGPIVFTRAGMVRGVRDVVPMLVATVPFGLVCGIVSQAAGLSLVENGLMGALVYAGSAQLVALSAWAHPAPVLAATVAAFTVNLRLALMGPVLAPWLDRLHGARLLGSLFVMADQTWALSVREMNRGGLDAAYLFGSGAVMWLVWLLSTLAGHLLGAAMRPAPGHPLFFAALAVFVSILVGMWRGPRDLLPWAVAAAVAILVARLAPGTSWYIVAGALCGALTGALRDRRRA